MNIYSITSPLTIQKYNARNNDTLSFGSSAKDNIKILLNTKDTSQYPALHENDIAAILYYFGYDKESDDSHMLFVNQYGYATGVAKEHKRTAYNDTIKKIVRGLRLLDEFNNELIMLEHDPSPEEIAKIKKDINSKPRREGHRNKNRYAQEMAAKQEYERDDVERAEQDATAKTDFYTAIAGYRFAITEFRNKQGQSKNSFDEINSYFQENEISQYSDRMATTETILNEADNKIAAFEQKLNSLQNAEKIDEDGLAELGESRNDVEETLDSVEASISALEEIYLAELDEVSAKEQKEKEAIESLKKEIAEYKAAMNAMYDELQEEADKYWQTFLDNKEIISNGRTARDLEVALRKAKDKIGKLKDRINNLPAQAEDDWTNKDYEGQFAIVKGIVRSMISVHEESQGTYALVRKELAPILNITETDFKKSNGQRFEKIRKKFEGQTAAKKPPQDKQPAIQKPKPIEVQTGEEEQQLIQAEQESAEDTKKQEAQTITSIVPYMPPIFMIGDSKEQRAVKKEPDGLPKKTVRLAPKPNNSNIIKFSEVLAKKIAPLEYAETIRLMTKLVRRYIKDYDLESNKGTDNTSLIFVNSIANKVQQSNEGQRIKNATRFAFLDCVFDASSNADSQIYNLDSKATKELFDKIQQGLSEISVVSGGKQIKITLNNAPEGNEINRLIGLYNIKMEYSSEIDKVLNKILEYAPQEAKERKENVKEYLKLHGSYFESLAKPYCDKQLKRALLELFWTGYDKKYGTEFLQETLKNYNIKLSELRKAQMQREKEEMFKNIDWSARLWETGEDED